MPMQNGDKALSELFMAATFHHWDILPGKGNAMHRADRPDAERYLQ